MISKKYIGVYLIFGVPLFILIFIGSMNYSGFCFAKMKYLTYDEKVLIVFNYWNSASERLITFDGGKNYSAFKAIPYNSFEEFTKENPDCCSIGREDRKEVSREIHPPDVFYRIIGYEYNTDEVITMNFKDRYLDKKGNNISRNLKLHLFLTNCGTVK